ncbi:MAG TPA: serine hydrolase [Beijerinckiaceae bacterium]|nr:serine hydrolase [Beijerinckiaceae bacterium]
MALSLFAILCVSPQLATAQSTGASYFPATDWERRTPAEARINEALLKQAVEAAITGETKAPRDLVMNHYQTFGREPFGYAIGPIRERGDPTGIVVHGGYIVAQWGDVNRGHDAQRDQEHAVERRRRRLRPRHDQEPRRPGEGLRRPGSALRSAPGREQIGSDRVERPDLPVRGPAQLPNHLGPHAASNQRLGGTLWGKPDWADRPGENPAQWITRPRNKPGTAYKYNDTRVNALALATLNLWRRPLPQVLKENILDPIGASNTWRWFGYENSWVILDGSVVQSMTGGGHWGGGMYINALDMARFGYLTLRRGKWKDRQLLSEQWIARALTPTGPEPTYGFMNFFLNTNQKLWPSAPASAFAHIGNGTNLVYVDPEHDLVAVARWIDNKAIDGFLQKLIAAVENK